MVGAGPPTLTTGGASPVMPVKEAALTVPPAAVTPPVVLRTPVNETVAVPGVALGTSVPKDSGAVLYKVSGATTSAAAVPVVVSACAAEATSNAAAVKATDAAHPGQPFSIFPTRPM